MTTEIGKDKKYLSWSSEFPDDNLNKYNSKDDNDDRKWAVWQTNPEIVVQFS